MRRPLTLNGVPLVQSGAIAPPEIIFDVQALDPQYVYAVTLYCWAPLIPGEIAAVVSAGVSTDGDPVVPIAFLEVGTNFENYRINGNGPAKVLNRLPLRGNQQLLVAKTSDNSSVFWFGYFERVGEAPMPVPYRPLMPLGAAGIVTPYNAPVPNLIVAPNAGATEIAAVHQLDSSNEQRLDYLWLDISTSASAAPDGAPAVSLQMPGGVTMPMLPVSNDPADNAGSPIRLFDGIPFRAPSQADNLFQMDVVGDATLATITAIASGHFARV